ncbi:MAG: hypothetical protein P4L67_04850 [Candidatus Pacebacteria bacterium]|nr:hypothetical protein [Candidatus Paceibacterota bacterium]
MRRPSARMAPHTVTVQHNAFGADQDGGARVASSTSSQSLRCFVQPGEARTIVDTSDETGMNRTIEFNPTKIYFLDDADLSSKDVLVWVDGAGRTRIYQVVGYTAPAVPAAQWWASCQEKT